MSTWQFITNGMTTKLFNKHCKQIAIFKKKKTLPENETYFPHEYLLI